MQAKTITLEQFHQLLDDFTTISIFGALYHVQYDGVDEMPYVYNFYTGYKLDLSTVDGEIKMYPSRVQFDIDGEFYAITFFSAALIEPKLKPYRLRSDPAIYGRTDLISAT